MNFDDKKKEKRIYMYNVTHLQTENSFGTTGLSNAKICILGQWSVDFEAAQFYLFGV